MNRSGMQSETNHSGWIAALTRWLWLFGSRVCCAIAWCMMKLGIHKQHANRMIELWSWHTVVVTSTEWENFFALRAHKDAQPEMQITARLMREAIEASTPRKLGPGEWHLPYIERDANGYATPAEQKLAHQMSTTEHPDGTIEAMVRMNVVRCAAVSFERQLANRTAEQFDARHSAMTKQAHWSPFEHQARVATRSEIRRYARFKYQEAPAGSVESDYVPVSIGNLGVPWLQYRKTFEGEDVFRG